MRPGEPRRRHDGRGPETDDLREREQAVAAVLELLARREQHEQNGVREPECRGHQGWRSGRAEPDRPHALKREHQHGERDQPGGGALPESRSQRVSPRHAERRERAPLDGRHDAREQQHRGELDQVVHDVCDRSVEAVERRAQQAPLRGECDEDEDREREQSEERAESGVHVSLNVGRAAKVARALPLRSCPDAAAACAVTGGRRRSPAFRPAGGA